MIRPPRLALGVVALLAVVAAILVVRHYYYPPERAGIRVVTNDANRMIQTHATDIQKDLNKAPYKDSKGRTDLNAWEKSRLPAATEVADAQDKRDAAIARAERRSIAQPIHSVDVYHSWIDCIPFYEPLEITVTGYVENLQRRTRSDSTPKFTVPLDDGYEMVGPNGTYRGDIAKDYDLPFPNDNHYLALVGRVAHPENRLPLTEPFLIGAQRVLDPKVVGASGCLQTAINKNPRLSGAKGQFSYSFHPVR